MVLDDLTILPELGVGIISLIIIYVFGKKSFEYSFKQIQYANEQLKESNERGQEIYERFINFMQETYEENSKSLDKLCELIADDMKLKSEKIRLLDEYKNLLSAEIHNRDKKVPKEYR